MNTDLKNKLSIQILFFISVNDSVDKILFSFPNLRKNVKIIIKAIQQQN